MNPLEQPPAKLMWQSRAFLHIAAGTGEDNVRRIVVATTRQRLPVVNVESSPRKSAATPPATASLVSNNDFEVSPRKVARSGATFMF
ncbi:MAG TPA: hypothetical protein VNA25_30360 [Phycisphaerae bacterium]|nr:hypothetical protein [Phycisphaerae bacterium]